MDEKWSRASFRIFSSSATPEEIKEYVGVRPTRTHRIGDPVSSTPGAPKLKKHSYCIESTLDTKEPLEHHIRQLLDLIPVSAPFPEEFEPSLFCGYSSASGQGGTTLDPDLLTRLARFGVPLVLDLYPPTARGEV